MTDATTASADDPFANAPYHDGAGFVDPQEHAITVHPTAPLPSQHGTSAAASDDDPFANAPYDDGSGRVGSAPVPTTPHPGAFANDPNGDSWLTGAAKGNETAVIKGIGHFIGFGGDLHDTVDYLHDWVGSKFTGETPEAYGARHKAAFDAAQADARSQPGILGAISSAAQGVSKSIPDIPDGKTISDMALSRTGEYVPQSEIGRMAMAGEEAGVGALGPGMGAAKVPAAMAPGAAGSFSFLAPSAAGAAAGKTVAGALPAMAASGAAGQAVGDTTGSPIAGMVAGIAAPVGLHAGYEGGRAVASRVGDYTAPIGQVGPFNKPTPVTLADGTVAVDSSGAPITATANQQRLAGQAINNEASDPEALRSNLLVNRQGPVAPDLVPGSKPTTFQKTGDMGLGQYERSAAVAGSEPFLTRASEQNQARVTQLGTVQPTGSPVELAQGFRNMRDQMTAEHDAALDQATTAASAARDAVPGANFNPEVGGAALRDPIAAARATAKSEENNLWSAVPKDLAVPTSPISKAVADMKAERSGSAKPLEGEEARLFDLAGSYGDHTTFGDIKDLRSDVSAEMSKQRGPGGDANSVRRLGGLRAAIEDSIDHGVENQAALDQVAVRRGTMAPEDALEARMRNVWGLDGEVQSSRQRSDAEAYTARTGTGDVGPGPARPSAAPSFVGAGGEGRGRFSEAPGNSGVSSPAPVVDAQAAGAMKAASAATKNRFATFDNENTAGAVAKVLEPGPTAGTYNRSVALAPTDIFHKGPTGGQDVRAYLKAGGSTGALNEAASASLRQTALKPDGTFDPAKVAKWVQDYGTAVNELPSDLRARYSDAAQAQRAVDETIAQQKKDADDFKKGTVAPLLGMDHPSSVVRQVGSIFGTKTAPETMGDLANRAAQADRANGTPGMATEGLRRAVVEHIQNTFLGNEAGTSGTPQIKSQNFINFLREPVNRAALGKVFTVEEIGKISAISQDLERAQRSVTGSKLKGGSNTPQDLALRAKYDEGRTIIGRLATDGAAIYAGNIIAGPISGGVGWLGARAVGALRQAGITKVGQLATEAMLNPELARALLEKAPMIPDRGVAARIGLIARQSVATQAQSRGHQQRDPGQNWPLN